MHIFDHLIQTAIRTELPNPGVLGIGGSPRKGGNSDVLLWAPIWGKRFCSSVAGKRSVNR